MTHDEQVRMQIEANQRVQGIYPGQQDVVVPKVSMIDAFGVVVEALQPLHEEARLRVLRAAGALLGLDLVVRGKGDDF